MFVLLDDYFPKDLFTPMETFSFRSRSTEEFLQRYPDGFFMKANFRNDLFGMIENDINFLERFRITDYVFQVKVCLKKSEESSFKSSNLFHGYSSCGEKLYFFVSFVDCLETKSCECLLGSANYSSKFRNILEEEVFSNIRSESPTPSAPSLEEFESSDHQMRLLLPSLKLEIIEEVEGEGDYDNIPIPKFGDMKSPSNVGDWLKIHEDIGIIQPADDSIKTTHFSEEEPLTSSPWKSSRKSETASTSFSPKITRFAEEQNSSSKKKLIDPRKSFRNKSIKTSSDKTSVFSYGGRSFRGSITRGFIPPPVQRRKPSMEDEEDVVSRLFFLLSFVFC